MQISTADDPAAIKSLLDVFDIEAAMHEGLVTFSVASGEHFVPRLFAEMPIGIRSVSVSRPSLDDVFMSYTGLSRLASRGMPTGFDFKTFIYPGVLAMSVLFTAIFSAASIVWDREFGFLREMLVAPVHRWAIVVGKCLGGAAVATFQGIIFLCLAGVAHVPYVPYDPVLLLTLVGELLLLSFTLTAFGVMMAARIKQIQAFMALTQMFVMPLFFLSGALYPLSGLPSWLTVLTRIDPLTYIVDPMRHAVFSHLTISSSALNQLSPGITWNGWVVPLGLSLAIVAAMGLAMLGAAIAQFRRTE